jgi:hypothetical protein
MSRDSGERRDGFASSDVALRLALRALPLIAILALLAYWWPIAIGAVAGYGAHRAVSRSRIALIGAGLAVAVWIIIAVGLGATHGLEHGGRAALALGLPIGLALGGLASHTGWSPRKRKRRRR